MPGYIPPSAQNVNLNFDQETVQKSRFKVALNFSDTEKQNTAFIVVNTSAVLSVTGYVTPPIDVWGSANIQINTEAVTASVGTFDINHIVGLYISCKSPLQRAQPRLFASELPWAKPISKAYNSAFFIDQAKDTLTASNIGFDKVRRLAAAVQSIHEQGTGLALSLKANWEENKRLRITQNSVFDSADKLHIRRALNWVELTRKRKQFTYSHEVAHVFEKRFGFDWDKGIELITTDVFPWDKAKSIHYRKHPVEPWPSPESPNETQTRSVNLNFCCESKQRNRFKVDLNFDTDPCQLKPSIPSIPNKNWWHILNNLSVTRLDNGNEIQALDGNYSTDRNSWCWSYSLTVPASEISKLSSIGGKPVILKIEVNGSEHHMLLESRTRSRKFAQDTFNLIGRSQSALLDAPYAPTRSFLQENERTARQLCQAELDRVNSQIQLNWQLIDELSWILPVNSLSYSNLTPIAVIKMIAESAGGFVYSEKSGQVLTVKPKYKKTFWDSIAVNDFDRLIPLSITMSQTIDDALFPDYNGITLTNDRNGTTGQVKRTGTSADVLQETVNNPLFTFESMGGYGKAALAKAGMVETHTLQLPVANQIGECLPGELTGFDAVWQGITDAVSVSFTHAAVNQTVKVERVNRE